MLSRRGMDSYRSGSCQILGFESPVVADRGGVASSRLMTSGLASFGKFQASIQKVHQLTELEKENDELCKAINENIERLRAQGMTPNIYEDISGNTPTAGSVAPSPQQKQMLQRGCLKPLIKI